MSDCYCLIYYIIFIAFFIYSLFELLSWTINMNYWFELLTIIDLRLYHDGE